MNEAIYSFEASQTLIESIIYNQLYNIVYNQLKWKET